MTPINKQRSALTIGIAVLLLGCGWLAIGVYSDREFGGVHIFLKHRLSSRFWFYSPHGESDEPNVTDQERRAEKDYTEFVESNGGWKRSFTIAN